MAVQFLFFTFILSKMKHSTRMNNVHPPVDNCYSQTIILPWTLNKAMSSFVGGSESKDPLYLLMNKTRSCE